MKRVVVTGSECTGKTTLAEALANQLQTVWVPEYVRLWVEEQGRAPEYEDVEAIAHGQIALEDSLAAQARDLIVLDCDLLSTLVYSRHYFGNCPPWVEQALLDRRADLYLLADVDVPWVPDGEQRDREDRREEMQELFRRGLVQLQLDFIEIRGSHQQRLRTALEAIERQLGCRQ
jgi:NadR type nicotinamide-nucleotide adenylyltransferase